VCQPNRFARQSPTPAALRSEFIEFYSLLSCPQTYRLSDTYSVHRAAVLTAPIRVLPVRPSVRPSVCPSVRIYRILQSFLKLNVENDTLRLPDLLINVSVYRAAVIIGRNTCLARPSVRSSVGIYRILQSVVRLSVHQDFDRPASCKFLLTARREGLEARRVQYARSVPHGSTRWVPMGPPRASEPL